MVATIDSVPVFMNALDLGRFRDPQRWRGVFGIVEVKRTEDIIPRCGRGSVWPGRTVSFSTRRPVASPSGVQTSDDRGRICIKGDVSHMADDQHATSRALSHTAALGTLASVNGNTLTYFKAICFFRNSSQP